MPASPSLSRLLKVAVVTVGVSSLSAGALVTIGSSGAGASRAQVAAHKPKAPKKAPKKSAAGCSSFQPGKKGVTQTFCTGKAVVTISIAGAPTVIKGGTCAVSGGYFTVNAGVIVSPSFKGTKPNYFGMDAPAAPGAFSNATIAYTVKNVGGYLAKNTGDTDHKSGTFTGTDLSGAAVAGTFKC